MKSQNFESKWAFWIFMGIANIAVAFADALPEGTKEMARGVIKASDLVFKTTEGNPIDIREFEQSDYWKKVLALGQAVSDEQLKALVLPADPDLESALAAAAATCSRKPELLRSLVLKYCQDVNQGPGSHVGSVPRQLEPQDATEETRALWETILLSPPLVRQPMRSTIRPALCLEALMTIGNSRSIPIILQARERLIATFPRAVNWETQGALGTVAYAGKARTYLVEPLAKLGGGTNEGLKALLAARRAIETEHPGLLRLRDLGVKLHPTDLGVDELLLEVIFAQKTQAGDFLWEHALRSLPPDQNRSPGETRLLKEALAMFDRGK